MFESYKTPGLFVAYQPLLNLYGIFEYQGVLVSVGDSVTYAVPIYETQVQFQAARRIDFGGRDLTRYLQQLLHQAGHSFTTSSELEIVREIKEKVCFVNQDPEQCGKISSGTNLELSHSLQDGSTLKLCGERHRCPEILFRPDGVFHQGKGIAEMIVESVMDCDIDATKDMYSNLLFSGGSTYFPGFTERLSKELHRLISPEIKNVMFEGYRSPSFYVAFEAILVLYSAGTYTGTMLSLGDAVTYVLPIYEGYALPQAVRRSDFGGRDLTVYLQHLLYSRGYSFTTSAELDIVREMKEQMCFIATKKPLPQTSTSQNVEEQSYQLPDGSYIKLGQERYQCPETLFQPDKTFNINKSLTELVQESLNACDVDTRRDLYTYIVLSGGSTFFPDFSSRLQMELAALTPKGVRTVAMPERKYHVWIGGSLLASLTSFQQMWVTRQEYEEYGPDILHRKCF